MTTQTQEVQREAISDIGAIETPANIAPRTTVVRDQSRATAPIEASPTALAYRHSETFGRLALALSQAQGEFQEIEKTLTAQVQSRREGARSYSYGYADLATVLSAVRPALSKHGLALLQMPTVRQRAVMVTTMLAHGESGEWFAGDLAVALDSLDPQAVGSATTYARRYGLTALLGVAAGEQDDDGAATQKKRQPAPDAPAGYQDWVTDLRAVADEGMKPLQDAWNKSSQENRKHLTTVAPRQWDQIKAVATEVDRKAKAKS